MACVAALLAAAAALGAAAADAPVRDGLAFGTPTYRLRFRLVWLPGYRFTAGSEVLDEVVDDALERVATRGRASVSVPLAGEDEQVESLVRFHEDL